MHGIAPECFSNFISILSPSMNNLRRNHDTGILSFPKVLTKNTSGIDHLLVLPVNFGICSRVQLIHFSKLLKSHRSRMMVIVQHRIILNTFNKQCTKTIQDDILFVSNFRRVFSNFDDRNLSSPGQARFNRFPFVHHSITHSCLNYLHSNAMIFVNNVFFYL